MKQIDFFRPTIKLPLLSRYPERRQPFQVGGRKTLVIKAIAYSKHEVFQAEIRCLSGTLVKTRWQRQRAYQLKLETNRTR